MFRRALVLGFLVIASLGFAANLKRLILKDGSYQVVQKYEIKGDVVRYYSAERSQWEEVPNSMVDWDATHKLEAKQVEAEKPKEVHIPTKEELAKAAEEAQTPEIATNVRLPKTGGVFVLDTYASKPQLVELTQNTGDINQHIGKNILWSRVNPIAMNTQTIELPGPKAKTQIHVARPAIYINVDEDPDDPNASVARKRYVERPSSDAYRFQFVKLEPKGKVRILGAVKSFKGEVMGREQFVVPTYGLIMDGDVWIKIEPKEDLVPGEYAVAEMLVNEEINRFVWDFGYDPKAPQAPPKQQPQTAPKK